LRGFADLELRSGLIIRDVCLHVAKNGAAWAALPARPLIDADGRPLRGKAGKIRYASVLHWRDHGLALAFSERVIALVRAHDPKAIDDEAGR
jgi:hypothetical protein